MCEAVRNDPLRSGATMAAVGGGAMAGGLVLKAVAPCIQALGAVTLVVSGVAWATGDERQKQLAKKGAIAGAVLAVAGSVGDLFGSALAIGGAVVAAGGAAAVGVGVSKRAWRPATGQRT